jgi:hypothetical protein
MKCLFYFWTGFKKALLHVFWALWVFAIAPPPRAPMHDQRQGCFRSGSDTCVFSVSLDGEYQRRGGKSQIMRQREILVLIISFNTLCGLHVPLTSSSLCLPAQRVWQCWEVSVLTVVPTCSDTPTHLHPFYDDFSCQPFIFFCKGKGTFSLVRSRKRTRERKGRRALSFLKGVDLPPSSVQRRQVEISWTSKIPSYFPLGKASDIAKPDQIYVKQRSCADVNSPYKRKCWKNSVVPLVNSLLWGRFLYSCLLLLSRNL